MLRVRDLALLMLTTRALDADQVRVTGDINGSRQRHGLDLFAVLCARDVPRSGLMGETDKSANDEQQHREGGSRG